METLENLWAHLKDRPSQLRELRSKGKKIVGYVPNGYMPEEIVHACGAIPVGLIRGGDHMAVATSERYLLRFIDTFCRAQIGYRSMGEDALYQLLDLLVVPITDRNVTAIADSWQFFTDVDVLKLGIPRYNNAEHALKYYLESLELLREKVERLAGTKIIDERLKEEIELSNRIRDLLKEISYSRKSECPPISGKDFIKLNHATYHADKHTLVEALESLSKELEQKDFPEHRGPRVMLTGSTMALGDNTLVDLLEESGAAIVIEEFTEGMRHYWQKVMPNDSLMEALADRYLSRRTPPAFFKGPVIIKERFDFLLKLIKEFRVDGVVWYSLLYRDSYDREGLLFSHFLGKEVGIPYLKLNSDYDTQESGPMRTRVETFIETINLRR